MPTDQVAALRHGIETFLLASQLTLVSTDQANATFARAREMATATRAVATYLNYVNDRAVDKLGPRSSLTRTKSESETRRSRRNAWNIPRRLRLSPARQR